MKEDGIADNAMTEHSLKHFMQLGFKADRVRCEGERYLNPYTLEGRHPFVMKARGE